MQVTSSRTGPRLRAMMSEGRRRPVAAQVVSDAASILRAPPFGAAPLRARQVGRKISTAGNVRQCELAQRDHQARDGSGSSLLGDFPLAVPFSSSVRDHVHTGTTCPLILAECAHMARFHHIFGGQQLTDRGFGSKCPFLNSTSCSAPPADPRCSMVEAQLRLRTPRARARGRRYKSSDLLPK